MLPDLNALTKKWQAILRLQDWTIEAGYKRAFDMPDGKQGGCTWVRRLKRALISVLDPQDYGPDPVAGSQDIEATLVHELLHIHFALVDDFAGVSMDLFEQSIDAIAIALVRLDRASVSNVFGV
jgi:hypothetical protein